MPVTREVVLDLTPLYLSGEASADSRALVDEYLSHNPELARWMAGERARVLQPLTDLPPLSLEARTLLRVRRRIGTQRWLFGIGWFCLAVSLSFEFTTRNGRVIEYHFLFRDHPWVFLPFLGAGLASWVAYVLLRRSRIDAERRDP